MLLQLIRDRATGWIAWVIVILISIPFALWGINEYLSPTSNVAVAVVNGTDISINEFQRSYQRQRAQLQSLLGGNFDISQLDEDRLREEALNQIVNDEVVLQSTLDRGMRVGDQQLALAIQGQDLFRENGSFSETRYQQWLRSQGYSPGGFETDLKRSMLTEQLVAGLATSAIVTKHEVDRAVRLQRQKRVVDTLTVPVARFSDVRVDESAVRAYYEENQVDFVSPEQVKLEYIEVSRDAIAAGVQVDDEELRAAYERRKADFQTPEQREASHILLILADGADEGAAAAARERLEELKRQIDAGASFAELAREHSEDPGSARQGGSLGPISRGVMDAAFENAVFELALDEVSDPVRSAFGLHLIQVDAINASKVPAFDEVVDKMRTEYQSEKAERAFVERIEIMTTLAFENPDSLEPVADALGLIPSVTDWMSPQASANSGIGRNPAVLAAAFNTDVLQDGFNSEAIDLDPSRAIVLRVAELRPSSQRSLEEVREAIEVLLATKEARKLTAESGRALLSRLEAGGDRQTAAGESELVWSGASELERNAPGARAEIAARVFRMARPLAGQSVYGGTVIGNGDFVIVALEKVIDGSLSAEEQEQRTTTQRNLEVEAGRASYDAVVQSLRNSADVVIIRENL